MSENNSEGKSTETETAGAGTPDIDLVDAGEWASRDFPIDDGRREKSVRVVIKQSVLNDIHKHGQTTTDVEICGVLLGNGYRDEKGPFVYVEANIRGQHSDSKAAQVTFTGETWNHIHNELDRDYPDLQILGWYHTHPGFGIFLSGMDLFIHESYFSAEHHLAFVYDPIGGDEGLFVWRNGKAVRDGFLIEPDAEEDPPPVATEPPNEPMTAGAEMTVSPAEAAADPELPKRLTRIENRLMLAELGVFGAVALAIVVPIAMWLVLIQPMFARVQATGANRQPEAAAPVVEPPSKPRQESAPTDPDEANDTKAKDPPDNTNKQQPSVEENDTPTPPTAPSAD